MCTSSCIEFIEQTLGADDVAGRRVLEVGACDFNGSVRSTVLAHDPQEYVGVDMQPGPGVDVVCGAEGLIERFGPASFDVVITTEMLEHVRNWRSVVHNLKSVLSTGGLLILTTRSRGFAFHGYPFDFWRYEISDMREIFSDMTIDALVADPLSPGVFLRARMPRDFAEAELSGLKLYSIVRRRRASEATGLDAAGSAALARVKPLITATLPRPVKDGLRRLLT